MSDGPIAFIVQCIHDRHANTMLLNVVRVDSNEAVTFKDGYFLLRISTAPRRNILRCSIRHLDSGREAYVQSSMKLRAFVEECLLLDDGSDTDNP